MPGSLQGADDAEHTARALPDPPQLLASPQQSTPPQRPHSRYFQTLAVCSVGFFVNCQPSEAYLTKYLKEDKHLTSRQLDNSVWPFDTYGAFIFLLLVAPLTEYCGYRPVIFFGLLCRQATRLLLLYGEGVFAMSMMQVTYAAATGANTVYYAYVYLIVQPQHFQSLTSAIHASYHLGNVLGSLIGEYLVSRTSVQHHLERLFYCSWAFSSLGLVCCVFMLPPPLAGSRSGVTNGDTIASHEAAGADEKPGVVHRIYRRSRDALKRTSSLYSNINVQLWSVWWLFGYGAHSILANYYQSQFSEIEPNGHFGLVEALIEIFDSVGAFLPLLFSLAFITRPGNTTLIIGSSSAAVAIAWYCSTVLQSSVYYSYVLNICALALYNFQYSLASVCIALCLESIGSKEYATVFAVNSSFALGIATIVQFIGGLHELDTGAYYIIGVSEQIVVIVLVVVVYFASKQLRSLVQAMRKSELLLRNTSHELRYQPIDPSDSEMPSRT